MKFVLDNIGKVYILDTDEINYVLARVNNGRSFDKYFKKLDIEILTRNYQGLLRLKMSPQNFWS